MSAQQTLSAMRRAAEQLNEAYVAYGACATPDELKPARRRLDAALDAYERARVAHTKALAGMIDDPRYSHPLRRTTKGL